jgi:hypothetical protein
MLWRTWLLAQNNGDGGLSGARAGLRKLRLVIGEAVADFV